jgi:hypothetical protein
MLECLPVAQEPGRRRRIAVEPTGGRFTPPHRPLPSSPLPLSLTCGPRGNSVTPRAPAPFSALGRRNRARALALCPVGPDPPPGPPEPKSFYFSFFSLFSFNYYISCNDNIRK